MIIDSCCHTNMLIKVSGFDDERNKMITFIKRNFGLNYIGVFTNAKNQGAIYSIQQLYRLMI